MQIIQGLRRAGRTTVLYQVTNNLLKNGVDSSRIFFLRLDQPNLWDFSLGDLVQYMIQASSATKDNPAYLMLDEVVNMEHWDKWLKSFYDQNWPVRIIATSSTRLGLKMGQIESGIDRWREQTLLPCSLPECLDLIEAETELSRQIVVGPTLCETLANLTPITPRINELEKYRNLLLTVGGFPELLTSYKNIEQFPLTSSDFFPPPHQIQLYENVVEKSIYLDMPKYFKITSPSDLGTILFAAARQMGNLWSPTNVSQKLGISISTINNYMTYLEMALLIIMLPNYPHGEAKAQHRGRKIYFTDSALRNAVLRRPVSSNHDPADYGHIMENLVVSSLKTLAEQTRFRLYHWRDRKAEVDVIYNDLNGPLAFEVGLSPRHSLSGLSALIEKCPEFHGNSYLVSPSVHFQAANLSPNGIGTIPLDLLLLAVDLQASHMMKLRFSI